MDDTHGAPSTPKDLALLTLGALGVVFGDIGTSPLEIQRIDIHAHLCVGIA